MFLNWLDPLFSHSLTPGNLVIPKLLYKVGLRRSPSISKTRCRFLRARLKARLAEIMLLPSSGIVLVTSNFFTARVCCSWRRRTARKRNFSAARLSFSVKQTSRASGLIVTGADGID